MDPKRFGTFKKFEANLTLIDSAHPACAKQFTPDGKYYADYSSTVTHGDPFGILSVTLDLYAPQGAPDHSCCTTDLFSKQGTCNLLHKPVKLTVDGTGPYCCPKGATEKEPCPKTLESPSEVVAAEMQGGKLAPSAAPCCKTCAPPLLKYYSVDVANGFCGEACMDPKRFGTFKKFEANLTLIDSAHPACAKQFTPDGKYYADYSSTVTHGDPFGILSVTLDLYAPQGAPDHSCCTTDLFSKQGTCNLLHKPVKLTVDGTGPYCCPKGATEKEPCPKTLESPSEVVAAEMQGGKLAPSAAPCCKTCAPPLL
eukprot:TRINITY_DN3021_c0_g1_i5.p1 TRINITY_DN3021_c0_g1~~TRINITY_DN3021_c0_g1_i5.p1  ORF type:complete len:335 (-),score=46.66 TRINITY_DN3021_c0_g1_i5:268-1200(-)